MKPVVVPYHSDPMLQAIQILLIAALARLGGPLTVTKEEYESIKATTGGTGSLRVTRDGGNITGSLTVRIDVPDGSARREALS